MTSLTDHAASITSTQPLLATEGRDWKQVLTKEEIKSLHEVSDVRSWISVVLNWAVVFGAMGLVAWAPNALTVVVAVFLIGARQLGFAVLMHEAAHRSLFRDPRVNDWVGNWLAAYPVWLDLVPYRRYHLQHHAKNWTNEDPDLALATSYPVSAASLRRKFTRDLTGRTGWKRFRATLARDLGQSKGKVRRENAGISSLAGVVSTNLALLAVLAAFGHPELYLLWIVAWFTTYSLVMRIRAIAEHSMTDDPADPMRNSRTTLVSWWERLLIAPNRVNFHLEHHLLMAVPHYRLPQLHAMLESRNALRGACTVQGYRRVLTRAASAERDGGPGKPGAGSDQTLTFG